MSSNIAGLEALRQIPFSFFGIALAVALAIGILFLLRVIFVNIPD